MSDLNKQYPIRVKYKNRIPNPGECYVISIDWEQRKLSVSNGMVRLFPGFDEVYVTSAYPIEFNNK